MQKVMPDNCNIKQHFFWRNSTFHLKIPYHVLTFSVLQIFLKSNTTSCLTNIQTSNPQISIIKTLYAIHNIRSNVTSFRIQIWYFGLKNPTLKISTEEINTNENNGISMQKCSHPQILKKNKTYTMLNMEHTNILQYKKL